MGTGSRINSGASLSLGIKPRRQDSWDLRADVCGSFLWLLHDLGGAGLVDGKTDGGRVLGFSFAVPVDDNSHKFQGVLRWHFSFHVLV